MKKKKQLYKDFFHKYNRIILFSVLLLVSLFVSFYFASAINDDDNKYTVTDITIESITDGTPEWNDSTDTNGNDDSNNNGVVRTHDTNIYDVTYKLVPKNNESPNLADERKIVIDFLIPTKVEGKVNGINLTPIFDNYSYVEFEVDETVSEVNKTIRLCLDDINAPTNTTINPKIFIREKTDSSTISINDLPEDKKGSYSDAITVSGFSDITPICNNGSCETRVTAREDYVVNVFKGGTTKEDDTVSTRVGYMIGLRSEDRTNIKGKYIPSTVEFTINSISRIGTVTLDQSKHVVTFGEDIEQDITDDLYMCDNCQEKLVPVGLDGDYNGTINSSSLSTGSATIRITNIKNAHVPLDGDTYYAFSTGSLPLTSKRMNSQVIGDIDISLNTNISNSNTISIVDNQERYIGAYNSTINLYDISDTTNAKTSGQAILNYGESFYINQNINYATTGGDDLDSLTSYVKIDNSAVKLINFEDGESGTKSINAYLRVSSSHIIPNPESEITFYYGDWTTDYFERTENADSYGCPTDISNREVLMNLYGGPCIREKNGMVKKYKDLVLDEASATDTGIDASYYERGPLLVKVTFSSTDELRIKDCVGSIKLSGRIKTSTDLINTTHQIVSSATGEFTGYDESSPSLYYLSHNANENGTSLITNGNNYTKTNYDYDNKRPITSHSNVCGSDACSISGNTIIVSSARTKKPTIKTTYNSKEKNSFYYYPIEWNIGTSGYKNDNSITLSDLTIDVYLPSYLVYTNAETIVDYSKEGEVGQKIISIEPISEEVIDSSALNDIRSEGDSNTDSYVKYTFYIDLLTSDFINTIPRLKVYTNIKLDTPNIYSFYGYSTVNYGAIAGIIGEGGIERQVRYETIEPIRDRSNSTEITVHNNSDITTQGTLTPRYLERNETYKYKMQAYNNSGSDETNAALYYVLPYKGDSAYEDLQSKFDATDFKVKLDSLPEGYTAYYNTSGISANIINNELHPDLADTNSWVEWTNPTQVTTEIKAIKIVKNSSLGNHTYFASEDGITVNVTPVGSNVGDIYYNQFYIITGNTTKKSYPSSRDKVTIYNREISGFVWEDYDYNGLFDDEESKLENIPVSLYRISDSLDNIDANDPSTFVGKEGEEWISDTITDSNGRYSFNGLTEGRYYVKFTYDDKKYTVTKKDAAGIDGIPATSINSKARAYSGGNVAISSIVTFDSINNSSYDILNLGLSIKKEFSLDVKNYIKNVTITSSTGINSYDYDKATKVSITLKNTNNKTARVTYDFVVENTKYFPGYVGLIQDTMPSGMTFNPNLKENQDWVLYGGTLYYTGLSGKLLVPNEKYNFSLVLDFDIKTGGNYVNFVSLENLVLMGDEVPEYEFINSGEGE